MTERLLLSSFDTWQAHQPSNSSDDLLQLLASERGFLRKAIFLRKLPVDFQLAPEQTLVALQSTQPRATICCGMAEARSQLTVESQGTRGESALHTLLDLPHLVQSLPFTEISHDAGDFVCNHLYYEVLQYWRDRDPLHPCLFVHVPCLTPDNTAAILADFLAIVRYISQFARSTASPSPTVAEAQRLRTYCDRAVS